MQNMKISVTKETVTFTVSRTAKLVTGMPKKQADGSMKEAKMDSLANSGGFQDVPDTDLRFNLYVGKYKA